MLSCVVSGLHAGVVPPDVPGSPGTIRPAAAPGWRVPSAVPRPLGRRKQRLLHRPAGCSRGGAWAKRGVCWGVRRAPPAAGSWRLSRALMPATAIPWCRTFREARSLATAPARPAARRASFSQILSGPGSRQAVPGGRLRPWRRRVRAVVPVGQKVLREGRSTCGRGCQAARTCAGQQVVNCCKRHTLATTSR